MTPAEIEIEIKQINRMLKRLSDVGNTLWETKNNLISEYKKLTGDSIS